MYTEDSFDEYTEDNRAFRKWSSKGPGRKESELDSESDGRDNDLDELDKVKRSEEEQST